MLTLNPFYAVISLLFFPLSLFAYLLSKFKTAASLLNAQDILTIRLTEKAAGQSARFDSAKTISSSWLSVMIGNRSRLWSLSFWCCGVDILFNPRQTAEQLTLELKLAKGLSSNTKGDWPMAEMRYARQKNVPKHRRFSRKHLKREDESIPNESLLKRQRIYSVGNNSAYDHLRISKRTLNNAALPISKSSRYSTRFTLLNLLKTDPLESFDKSLTKWQKILK